MGSVAVLFLALLFLVFIYSGGINGIGLSSELVGLIIFLIVVLYSIVSYSFSKKIISNQKPLLKVLLSLLCPLMLALPCCVVFINAFITGEANIFLPIVIVLFIWCWIWSLFGAFKQEDTENTENNENTENESTESED